MQRAVCSVFKCCKVDVLLEQPVLLAQISLAVEPASTTLCLMVVKVVEKVGRPTETDVVANYGLSAIFHPGDLRCQTGGWPLAEFCSPREPFEPDYRLEQVQGHPRG